MSKPKPYKRVLVGSDLHCGHRVGLTPPKFQSAACGEKYRKIQIECWKLYTGIIDKLKPIDRYLINGDAIDGSGTRSGGTELIVPEIKFQKEMGAECIKYAEAEEVRMTRGTDYHTSPGYQDAEDDIAKELGGKIGDHEWFDVYSPNGEHKKTYDMKHHLGNTSMPYGKGTKIEKDQVLNLIWKEYCDQPRGNIFIRSHVHWEWFCGNRIWTGFVTPALQAMGSKFGGRKCNQHVDFGLLHIDHYNDGSVLWNFHTVAVPSQQATAEKL